MTTKPTHADHDAERSKLDLLPKREGAKRADDLLRALLNTPPDPFTPQPTPKKRGKKLRGSI